MATLIGETIGRILSMIGWDGTNFRPVKTDTAGELQVDVLSSALPAGAATETTVNEISDRIGDPGGPVDGTTNAVLLEIEERLDHKWLDVFDSPYDFNFTLSASSGTMAFLTTTVAAGKLVVITHIFFALTAGSLTRLNFYHTFNLGGSNINYCFRRVVSPVVDTEYLWRGMIILQPDDRIYLRGDTIGAGTTAEASIHGYYVDLT